MRLLAQSAKFRQAVIIALVAYGLLIWAVAEARKSTGREELKAKVAAIRSNVSEAAKVLDAAETGRLTAKFFQIETEMLREQLVEATRSLDSVRPGAGFEGSLAQARKLAESAASELGVASSSYRDPSDGDRSEMEKTRVKLGEIFGQTVALEESLKR
jgi:hypothetical protein